MRVFVNSYIKNKRRRKTRTEQEITVVKKITVCIKITVFIKITIRRVEPLARFIGVCFPVCNRAG